MTDPMLQPVFPSTLRFVDTDPAERADEETRPLLPCAGRQPPRVWNAYLARMLPPVRTDVDARLRTAADMADFLVSLGPSPARAVAQNLRLTDRSGFWRSVQREIEELAPEA